MPTSDPNIDDQVWTAATSGELAVQRCSACGYLRWPPSPLCPECQSDDAAWVGLKPIGTLWSYATYYRAFSSTVSDQIPYSVGLVELDEGPRIYGRWGGLNEPVIGERVIADFSRTEVGRELLRWVPLEHQPMIESPSTKRATGAGVV